MMMIYDYKTPNGRRIESKLKKSKPLLMTVRYLTEEEKRDYGCDNITVIKKRCACCQQVKSDYAFFYSATAPDGLSSWCRRCVAQREKREEKSYERWLKRHGRV